MDDLHRSIACVPGGSWAVGVSGGADSVALLMQLHARGDLKLHVVHLDHETRGGESARDAEFVREMCAKIGVPCSIEKRSAIELRLANLPANLPARYRRVRLQFFRDVIGAHALQGVILAHHADDQAETVLLRLLRGSGHSGLCGMHRDSLVGGVRIIRPLLEIPREVLRDYLRERQIPWREDASNLLDTQRRNRVRKLLALRPHLTPSLLELAAAASLLTDWIRSVAPQLPDQFRAAALAELSPPLARESARRWLAEHGKTKEIAPAAIERLLRMSRDAATPPHQVFAGNLHVRRRRGIISVTAS